MYIPKTLESSILKEYAKYESKPVTIKYDGMIAWIPLYSGIWVTNERLEKMKKEGNFNVRRKFNTL